jgi:hypothetical protein
MRIPLLMLIAIFGLVASATVIAETPSPAAAPPAKAAALNEAATWQPRKLVNFSVLLTDAYPDNTCEVLMQRLTFVLLQLGARASNLAIDARGCTAHQPNEYKSVDASFSVLVPTDKTGNSATGAFADARWQTVELRANGAVATCAWLKYVTEKVLPLFSARDMKLIPETVCEQADIGLRAQVLKPTQESADAR